MVMVIPLFAMDPQCAKIEGSAVGEIDYSNQQRFAKLVKSYIQNREVYRINKFVGANFNLLGQDGQGPIHFAVMHGFTTAVELLLQNEADINFPDRDGMRPLHYFCQLNPSLDNFQKLKKLFGQYKQKNGVRKNYELDVNAQDKKGLTPLHYACQSDNLEAVIFLRSLKVRLNIQDENQQYPLELTRNKEIMRILILAGAKGVDSIKERVGQKTEQLTNEYYAQLNTLGKQYAEKKQPYCDLEVKLASWTQARKNKKDTLQKAKKQLSSSSISPKHLG